MVFGILVIILGILGIAVFGRDVDQANGAIPGAVTSKESLGQIPQKPERPLGGGDDATDEHRANAKDSGSKPPFISAVDLDSGAKPLEDVKFPESSVPNKKVDAESAGAPDDHKKETAPPAAPPKDEAPKTYKVKKGDTLTKIAVAVFGDKKYADEIQKANPSVKPEKMFENQVLTLPSIKKEAPEPKSESPKSVASVPKPSSAGLESAENEKPKAGDAPKTHVVQAGEKLQKISKRYYGDDMSKVKAIQKLNAGLVKDWANIPAGTILKLP